MSFSIFNALLENKKYVLVFKTFLIQKKWMKIDERPGADVCGSYVGL